MRKENVLIGGIKPEAVLGIFIVEGIFRKHKEVFVLTSVTDGIHGEMSYHPNGYAWDVRLPMMNIGRVVNDCRRGLGPEYDVVVHGTHLHFEFEVRRRAK